MQSSNRGLIKFLLACLASVLASVLCMLWVASGQQGLSQTTMSALDSPITITPATETVTPETVTVTPATVTVTPETVTVTPATVTVTPETVTVTPATVTVTPTTVTVTPETVTVTPATVTVTPTTVTVTPTTPVVTPPTQAPVESPAPATPTPVVPTATVISVTQVVTFSVPITITRVPITPTVQIVTATETVVATQGPTTIPGSQPVGTDESMPSATSTLSATLPEGMVIVHIVARGTAQDWQVVVCVANLGGITATQVSASALWPAHYRALALRSHSGPIELEQNQATARFGDMPPGRQVQVSMLLAADEEIDSMPGVQTRLIYKDGPGLADSANVKCDLQGVRPVPPGESRVQEGSETVGTVGGTAAPVMTSTHGPASVATPIAEPRSVPILTDQPIGQLAPSTWLCFGPPLVLLLLVVLTLTYKMRARAAGRA
jgi:hypothetical protein